jgi:hypothetical protein
MARALYQRVHLGVMQHMSDAPGVGVLTTICVIKIGGSYESVTQSHNHG